MWSPHIAELLADALRRSPELHLVVVVPRHPGVDGRLALPPNQVGRLQAVETCHRAAPDRVHVFDRENAHGTPVYVHATVAVVDDTWACAGSANLNRRSWTHDSELSVAVLGPGFARGLRLELLRGHLDREPGDDADLQDPDGAVRAVEAAADALDDWHDAGRRGPRPPGRLRRHRPLHRTVHDPDGCAWRDRLHRRW